VNPVRAALAIVLGLLVSCDSPSETARQEIGALSIEPDQAVVTVGATVQLQATVLDPESNPVSDARLFWSSEDTLIATVSENGEVLGRAPGTVRVAASANGVSSIATIVVQNRRPHRVQVLPASVALLVGQERQFEARALDEDGNELDVESVEWSSSDPEVVSVSSEGLAKALRLGAAEVVATIDGRSGSAGVAVGPQPVASVEITPESLELIVGETQQLEAITRSEDGAVLSGRDVEWSSSDERVARVDKRGLVTAVRAGSATITATSEGKSGAAQVSVEDLEVGSVEVEPDEVEIVVGASLTLEAIVRAANGVVLTDRKVEWKSEDSRTAQVDRDGVVTGRRPGETVITARSEGHEGSARVTVVPPPVHSIELDPTSLELAIGESADIQATLRAEDGTVLTDREVEWESSDESVAVVDDEGEVTAVAKGKAEIVARSEGQEATAEVQVFGRPARIEIVSGNNQEGNSGESLEDPLVVRVVDLDGDPVPRVTVEWSTTTGSMDPETTVTDEEGLATSTWTLGGGLDLFWAAWASVEGVNRVVFRAMRD